MNVGNQVLNLDKILREDDDEFDFLPAAGSNLAAIFGLQIKTSDSCFSIKQVSKMSNTPCTSTQPISNKTEVIIAKAVHAFKLQNGAYISIGKLGMALTGNLATKVYQIILYKSKQEHVSVVTVTHNFLYIIQPNNYSSYYDNNNEVWTILFENNDICVEFAKEVGLARYFSKNGKIENVLYQDLSSADKDVIVKEGDKISIKYFIRQITQSLLKNIPLNFQTMTVEVSTDDNWERTLLGSSKGLKRILFVPPSKQISLGPGFPKEKDIILEVEIIQILEETDHLHKSPSGKASIISRMAKMGQSILPKLPTSTDSEDTEDDIPCKSTQQKKVEPVEEESQNASIQIQPNFTLDGQICPLQTQTVPSTVPTIIDSGLTMLLSETRMTNAELRMGMSKIADNVQKLLDKFHVLGLQNAASPIKDKTVSDTTLSMLLAMNASEEKDSQSHKNINIATENSLQLNEMKQRMSLLEKQLKESKEQIDDLKTQKEFLIEAIKSLHKTIEDLKISLKDADISKHNMKRDIKEVKELNTIYEKEIMVLEDKILKLSEECNTTEEAGDYPPDFLIQL
ncbi:PREDICTED: FK506-binding protein 15-like [Eufriesea mexicana]|uniref:FK506-binding protein 15-like n=1 Tax=Eufriesea mexicana TaxID=516756 RepID=UPI00083BCFF0|nr:PREDICTED: FK506-binding protein 15-like [Eufriesea mexicana]